MILIFPGPKLPFQLSFSSMVPSPSGRGLVVIGGWNDNEGKHSNVLLELKGSSMEWVPLKQTLQYARHCHVAIPIPDDWEYCSRTLSDGNQESNGGHKSSQSFISRLFT